MSNHTPRPGGTAVISRPAPFGAACATADPLLFFAPEGETVDERKARESLARGICARCPSRLPCLEWAMATGQEDGIWGGVEFGAYYGPMCRNQLHLMDAANTWIDTHGSTKCRACRNIADQRDRARRQDGGNRRLQQVRAAARASADARAARARREITETEAAGEQRCAGPCGLVKALGEFSQRKGRRRYRVCKRCRADAELLRLRQAADPASPDPQAREKTAA